MSEMHVLLMCESTGPWHWQQWLASQLSERGIRVDLPSPPESPALDGWLALLRQHLASVPENAELVVATYSRAAALWLHHAATIDAPVRRADRVLLVAPPDPERHSDGLVSYPVDARSLRHAAGVTRIVAGTGDPSLSVRSANVLADMLRVELDVIPDGEHLDTDAGYGPWPSVLRWVLYGSVPLLDRFDSLPAQGDARVTGTLTRRPAHAFRRS
jgi:uncharacterized protein